MKKLKCKGFSILEVTISMAIIIIMISFMLSIFISLINTKEKVYQKEVYLNALNNEIISIISNADEYKENEVKINNEYTFTINKETYTNYFHFEISFSCSYSPSYYYEFNVKR